MPRMRWRPGLCPGPRWGSSWRSNRPSSRRGKNSTPSGAAALGTGLEMG